MPAGSTACGPCTSGSTARPWAATSPASGGGATTSTDSGAPAPAVAVLARPDLEERGGDTEHPADAHERDRDRVAGGVVAGDRERREPEEDQRERRQEAAQAQRRPTPARGHQNVGVYRPKTSAIAPHTSPSEQRSARA